jgi:D-serine ammonia-lyase
LKVLYGAPIAPSTLPLLDNLSKIVTTRLIIDHPDHISLPQNFQRDPATTTQPWSVFIKLDMGAKRAGLPVSSPVLVSLLCQIEASPNVELYGFYAYSSHAHCTECVSDAEHHLQEQVTEMLRAAEVVADKSAPLVLSVGSSPTARVIKPIKEKMPPNVTFEIHAGGLILNDLQQLVTGTIDESQLAVTVMAEISSVYPHRNEAFINAGVLALTREPQPASSLQGIARVRDVSRPGWIVGRVSQEHGILVCEGRKVEDDWKIGDKVELDIQYSCIAAAMFGWYFVVDEEGIVMYVYFPWKWW